MSLLVELRMFCLGRGSDVTGLQAGYEKMVVVVDSESLELLDIWKSTVD